jgi:hypothetical protein
VLSSGKLRKFPGLNFHAVFGLIARSLSFAQTGWNREIALDKIYEKFHLSEKATEMFDQFGNSTRTKSTQR